MKARGGPQGTHRVFTVPSVDVALRVANEVKAHKAERVIHGPKPFHTNSHPGTKEPDSVILEIRRLHESGMTAEPIRIYLQALGISLTRIRINKIAEYTPRSHLVPDGRTTSYLEAQ